MTGRLLEVVAAGLLTTIQDRGRAGHAHVGVPPSGALDAPSAALANRLVGNDGSAAVLETTMTGPELRNPADGEPIVVAVTGAPAGVRIDGRPAPFAAPIALLPGQRLVVGPVTHGVRSYLAFAGGVDARRELGSRSTDLLSGLGPPPIAAGDVLPVGVPRGKPAWTGEAAFAGISDDPVLEFVLGPRNDWFAPAGLLRQDWTVSSTSNRIGLRVEGVPLTRIRGGELPPEPMVTGSIQVPPDGRPIVFGNDHPTTGGYPVIGVLTPASQVLAAQAAPGRKVRFVAVGTRGPG